MRFLFKNFIPNDFVIANSISILYGIIFLLVNTSIFSDGWIEADTAFWLEVPLLIIYSYALVIVFNLTIKGSKSSIAEKFISTILILINILVFVLNMDLWIDMFDGRTNILFP